MRLSLDLGLGSVATLNAGVGVPAWVNDIYSWWDMMASPRMTESSNVISRVGSRWAGLPLIGGTSAQRPGLSSDRTVFDGSSDFLVGGLTQGAASFVSRATWPDGLSGSAAGKGPTCTGLGRFSNGDWLLGNDGRATSGAGTFDPSVARVTTAGVVVWECKVSTLPSAPGTLASVQGCVVRPDDTVGFIHAVSGAAQLYILNSDGTYSGLVTLAFSAGGLAYDADASQFIVGSGNGASAFWVNGSGTVVKTVRFNYRIDHLFWTSSYLYYTYGENGEAGHVARLGTTSLQPAGEWTLPETLAIEGVVIVGSGLYVNSDQYFHPSGDQLNQLVAYTITADPTAMPTLGDRFMISGLVKIASAPGSTVCLAQLSDPLDNAATPGGMGIYVASGSSTAIRLIASDGAGSGNRSTLDFAVGNTTEFLFNIDVDYAAKTAQCFINDVSLGAAGSLANISSGGINAPIPVVGAAMEGGIGARFSASTWGGLSVVRNGHSNRQEIAALHAWNGGKQSLLDASNPWKNTPPPLAA